MERIISAILIRPINDLKYMRENIWEQNTYCSYIKVTNQLSHMKWSSVVMASTDKGILGD